MATKGMKITQTWHNPLAKNIRVFDVSLREAVWRVVQHGANEGQNYMRSNAPWTDRTGAARGGLFGRAFREGNGYRIVYYHTAPYGIWLEVANDGNYRIIEPTLQVMGPQIMARLQAVMNVVSVA